MKIETIMELALEKNSPCVTISLNTHRTHPSNANDIILLKNLCKEAEERLIEEFGKKPISSLLDKLDQIPGRINVNSNLDSLQIFLSNETSKIVKSIWKTQSDNVHISDTYDVRNLIKDYNRSEEYFILLLTQGGVKLFNAMNDNIVEEIINEDFPFAQNQNQLAGKNKLGYAKQPDILIHEYFNKVDKAVMKIHNQTDFYFVVISTEDNFAHLKQIAKNPDVYIGHAIIDNKNTSNRNIISQSWEIVKGMQTKRRTEAISEMKDAISSGKVLTDLQEIYRAAKEGRGDLLITHNDFCQAVKMKGEFTFELTDNVEQANVIDDITSDIAWEVISKKGRAIFTTQDEIKDLGLIVLKTRF